LSQLIGRFELFLKEIFEYMNGGSHEYTKV
jgi:hypothetical protein